MTWQIACIALYARERDAVRRLEFSSGLNIVTGRSSRGKSSILDIAQYGMLSKYCPISKGVIRDRVSHVAVELKRVDGERFVTLRPLPREGRVSSSEAYVSTGRHARIPEKVPLLTSNVDIARELLSEFTGIDSISFTRTDEDADETHPASIRHCVPFLFQPQDVIANRNLSFPGLDDPYRRRSVLDALTYFLGVLDAEDLHKKQQMRVLKAELAALQRDAKFDRRRRAMFHDDGLALWTAANALTLAPDPAPVGEAELLRALTAVTRLSLGAIEDVVGIKDLAESQANEVAIRGELEKMRYELSTLRKYLTGQKRHEDAVDAQADRLRIRELLPESATRKCPLCDSGNVDVSRIENELSEAIATLEANRASPKRLTSAVQNKIERLEADVELRSASLKLVQRRLDVLLSELNSKKSAAQEYQRRLRLMGQIEQFLLAQKRSPVDESEIRTLELAVTKLDARVGEGAIRDRRLASENEIQERMTALASELDVEFPDHSVRINLRTLAFEILFGKSEWVPLGALGSGANWLGYHVAGSVALARFFVDHDAPVPHVLFLDQPSQAWFPADRANSSTGRLMSDRERQAVLKVYRLLAQEAKDSKLQIIVADHALLDAQFFVDAVVADWHNDGALVPTDW